MTLGHPIDFIGVPAHLCDHRLEYIDITPAPRRVRSRQRAEHQLFSFCSRNLFNSGTTSAIRFAISWDSRNNRLFPTEGVYAMASTEISDSLLASDNNFIRHELNLRLYKPIWGPFVAKLNTQWGLVTSRDGRGVPIYERYFLGGITDVRGFDIQSIGPRLGIAGTFNDPTYQSVIRRRSLRRQHAALLHFEIEFPIIESVGIKGCVPGCWQAWNLEQSLWAALRRRTATRRSSRAARTSQPADVLGLRHPLVLSHSARCASSGLPVRPAQALRG